MSPAPSSSSPLPFSKPELLSPAGDWDCARAAVANGANAIYFGMPSFNARIRATNFTEEDLPRLMEFLHEHGVKGYVAFNTLIFTSELEAAARQLNLLHRAGVDAAIVQDVGLCALAHELVPDFHIHASTQMTITSPEGLAFAARLGISRAVLARELSLKELAKFATADSLPILPVEVFVHGALCVAYSGQCLTSEALGQRSANRGECAQACRMPYELVVDGKDVPLGDRRYLLSPQDLAAVEHIPDLIRLGITSFKIEGRLKTPEYVAAVTQVYRRAIDEFMQNSVPDEALLESDQYLLEMAFSRGLYTGWLGGVNHQRLVHARFGKKRGAYVGEVARVGRGYIELALEEPILSKGDGIVIDNGTDTDHEQGGRIYEIKAGEFNTDGGGLAVSQRIFFEHGKIDFQRVKPGDRIWKTSDPQMDRTLRRTFERPIEPPKKGLHFKATGGVDSHLVITAWLGDSIPEPESAAKSISTMPLQEALKHPMTSGNLLEQIGRLGNTPFKAATLDFQVKGQVILPKSDLNRMKRELVEQLLKQEVIARAQTKPPVEKNPEIVLGGLLGNIRGAFEPDSGAGRKTELVVLCRSFHQIEAALESKVSQIYVDFEDIRRLKDAVEWVKGARGGPGANPTILLATPRIHKAGETGIFRLIENAGADGILVRNLGALDYFRQADSAKYLVGDFSLNVANPITASHFMAEGLDRLTVSYDLNSQQVLDLLEATPPHWLEITLHQHIPMFHMEHCVFAAFLSDGTDYTNCGRPCETHQLELRDRVGLLHPVKVDVGCRNTVFHAQGQSGASAFESFVAKKPAAFRVELLGESKEQARSTILAYQELLSGKLDAAGLLRRVKARNQLGVTVPV